MLGICKTLDCYFGTRFDPSDDTWDAIAAERKFLSAFRYEQDVPADARKIVTATRLTDAHARKLRRLSEQFARQTGQNAPVISERAAEALAYLERAS